MRSDVIHLAKCGEESAYFCRMRSSQCSKLHANCKYKLKTIKRYGQSSGRKKNEIHPIAIDLTKLYIQAAKEGKPATAWCIDLARTALTAELIADMEGKPEMYAQNKVRHKIERDKGVRII